MFLGKIKRLLIKKLRQICFPERIKLKYIDAQEVFGWQTKGVQSTNYKKFQGSLPQKTKKEKDC